MFQETINLSFGFYPELFFCLHRQHKVEMPCLFLKAYIISEQSTHVLVTLPIHKSDQVSNQVSNQAKLVIEQELNDKVIPILIFVRDVPKSKNELLSHIKVSNQTKHKKKYIDPLLDYKRINYTIPKNPKNRNQKYTLSELGKKVLRIVNG